MFLLLITLFEASPEILQQMLLAQHPPHIPSPCLAWQPPDPKQLVRRTNLAQSHISTIRTAASCCFSSLNCQHQR